MRKMISLYIARYWKRDVIAMLIVVVIALAIYYLNGGIYTYRSLGTVRHELARFWVFASLVYTTTAFTNYGSASESYGNMLLPASTSEKYFTEVIRTLIVMPVVFMLLIMAADYCVSSLMVSNHTLLHTEGMWYQMTYKALPLYHLPVMPYYLVTVVAAVLLIRSTSGVKQIFTVLFAVIIVAMVIVDGPHDRGAVAEVYPYVIGAVGDMEYQKYAPRWVEAVTWTGLPMKPLLMITYLWLLLIPAFSLVTAYFNLKERSME